MRSELVRARPGMVIEARRGGKLVGVGYARNTLTTRGKNRIASCMVSTGTLLPSGAKMILAGNSSGSSERQTDSSISLRTGSAGASSQGVFARGSRITGITHVVVHDGTGAIAYVAVGDIVSEAGTSYTWSGTKSANDEWTINWRLTLGLPSGVSQSHILAMLAGSDRFDGGASTTSISAFPEGGRPADAWSPSATTQAAASANKVTFSAVITDSAPTATTRYWFRFTVARKPGSGTTIVRRETDATRYLGSTLTGGTYKVVWTVT